MNAWIARPAFRWIPSISLVLLLVGCGDQGASSFLGNPPSTEPVQLPVRWTLTDQTGRTLEAMVLGRTLNKVKLRRLSDNQEFEIGIETLTPADQERIKQLPIAAVPKSPAAASKSKMSWEAQRIQEDLDETLKEIASTQELHMSTDSKIQRRTLGSKLNRLLNREAELRAQLNELLRAEQQRR